MSTKLRVTYNAPVILTFAAIAVVVQILGKVVEPYVVAYPNFDNWRASLGLVTHIFGHANWDHLLANFGFILLIGPMLEERYGSGRLLIMIAITAIITGLFNATFMNSYLLGASGIVFMLIVLASTANIRQGEVPLTFIAIVLLSVGREVVHAFRDDQISQMAHILGGLVGGAFGFIGAKPGTIKADALAKAAAPKPLAKPAPAKPVSRVAP